MNRRILTIAAIAAAIGCGDNNADNSATNNTATNNTATNNTATNNTATNNTATNNTATNNTTTTNNTTAPFGFRGDCRRVSVDTGGDGSVDSIRVEQASDPAYQNVTGMVFDDDADGAFDWGFRNTQDGDGNVLTTDVFTDRDGTADQHGEYTYDADGNQLTLVVTDDGGEVFVTTWTYDANGNLLTRTEDGKPDVGGRPDGNPEYVETLEYVGDQVSLHEIDADGDGNVDYRLARQFNADGKWTFRTRDGIFDFDTREVIRAADGIPDEEETLTRDANGVSTRIESDGDVGPNREQADGIPDIIQRNLTWENDQLVYFEADGRTDVTNDITTIVADGTFDAVTATFDARGNRTSWILDEGMDGTDDIVDRVTYDADGMFLTLRRDGVLDNDQVISESADGVDNWIQTLTWHAPNYPATHGVDGDGDGTDDFVREWTWADTSYGVVQTSDRVDGGHWYNEVLATADGTWDYELSMTLDDQERQSEQRLRNGNAETVTTWEYGSCSDFL